MSLNVLMGGLSVGTVVCVISHRVANIQVNNIERQLKDSNANEESFYPIEDWRKQSFFNQIVSFPKI